MKEKKSHLPRKHGFQAQNHHARSLSKKTSFEGIMANSKTQPHELNLYFFYDPIPRIQKPHNKHTLNYKVRLCGICRFRV